MREDDRLPRANRYSIPPRPRTVECRLCPSWVRPEGMTDHWRDRHCRQGDHDWSAWSLWRPVVPSGPPAPVREGETEPFRKVRDRQCIRCGVYGEDRG